MFYVHVCYLAVTYPFLLIATFHKPFSGFPFDAILPQLCDFLMDSKVTCTK